MGDVTNDRGSGDSEKMALQKLHRRRMGFLGIVILVAGIVIGAALARVIFAPGQPGIYIPPGVRAEKMLEMLDDVLGLSGEQKEKLGPVLKQRFAKLEKIHEEVWPQIAEELRLINQDISSVLDEAQSHRWAEHGQKLRFPGQFRPGPRRGRRGPESFDRGPRRSPDDRGGPPRPRGEGRPPSPNDRPWPPYRRGEERPPSPNDGPAPLQPHQDERAPIPNDVPAPPEPEAD
jgi:hypothetical protein